MQRMGFKLRRTYSDKSTHKFTGLRVLSKLNLCQSSSRSRTSLLSSPPSFSFSLKLSFPCTESQHLHQKSKIFQQSRTDKALLNRQLFPWTESQHLQQASRFSERNREQWRNLLNFYGEFEGSCLGLYFGGIRYLGLVGHAHESGCWLETESISNFRFRLPVRPRRRWNGGSVDAVSCSVTAVSDFKRMFSWSETTFACFIFHSCR
jgi:hypothetical protein